MKYRSILAVALVLGGASQAQAQKGFRAEVHAGWDHPSIHVAVSDGVNSATEKADENGLLYGAEIGYDVALGRFDLGLYGGIDGSTAKYCTEIYGADAACIKAGRNFSVGARAGLFLSEGILAYVKGGYSNGAVKLSYRDALDPANDFGESDNMNGYHVGGGIQTDVGDNIYAKLEYVHVNYDDYDYRDGSLGGSLGVSRDNLLFGVGIRF